MLKEIDGVRRERVGVRALHQGDHALVEGPHVDATVRPICEQQVQGPPSRAQVVARAKLSPAAFKRLLDRVVEVEVEGGGP